MTEIYVYTSNRKDATAVSIEYDKFVDLVNQFYDKDYLNDDNDFLQFKRNVKRNSSDLTTDNVKSIKRQQNAFKLTRHKSVLLERALRARQASDDLEYMDEQGFYIPKHSSILGFNHSISPECNDDIIINTRLSLTVYIEEVGDFVEELEALVKKYSMPDNDNTVEITDTALENAFQV